MNTQIITKSFSSISDFEDSIRNSKESNIMLIKCTFDFGFHDKIEFKFSLVDLVSLKPDIKIELHECEFKDKVDLELCNYNKHPLLLNQCTFYEDFKILDAHVDTDLAFNKCTFINQFFAEDTFFKKETHFSGSIFKKEAHFEDSEFNHAPWFDYTSFENKLIARNLTLNNGAFFLNSNFIGRVNFSDLKSFNNDLNFIGSSFEENSYFYNSKIDLLNLECTIIEKNLSFLKAEIKSQNRETARIIKNEFIKQNNKIESLDFHAREMAEYYRELNPKKCKLADWRLIKWLKKILAKCNKFSSTDRFILYFNKITNNHGLNPFKALFCFTLPIAIISFIIYVITFKNYPIVYDSSANLWNKGTWDAIFTVLSHFLEFSNPTHKTNFITDDIYGWSSFIDYFSRILIGLGLYQTIQAFRKHKI